MVITIDHEKIMFLFQNYEAVVFFIVIAFSFIFSLVIVSKLT